jgi:hypothetical protein
LPEEAEDLPRIIARVSAVQEEVAMELQQAAVVMGYPVPVVEVVAHLPLTEVVVKMRLEEMVGLVW